jgi:uncharacterized protein (TIGR02145 family)
MKKYIVFAFLFCLALQNRAQTVTDIDGNTYNTVTIGTQVWMKENLKTVHYNNGDAIPNVTDNNSWGALTSGAYCDNNNLPVNGTKYGHLYNFYAVVDSRNLCPTGWHIPTGDEWALLESTLGEDSVAGKMKSTTSDWRQPNVGATNESGFSALPGGYRDAHPGIPPYFLEIGLGAFFYSLTENHIMGLHDNSTWRQGTTGNVTKECGLSIRCLKDENATSVNNLAIPDNFSIYPNPATDKLYINTNNNLNSRVIIIDMQGKQIINSQIDGNTIDISNLAKGIYLVKIIDFVNITTNKIIIE